MRRNHFIEHIGARPDAAFRLYTQLLDADIENEIARRALNCFAEYSSSATCERNSPLNEKSRILLQSWLPTSGLIRLVMNVVSALTSDWCWQRLRSLFAAKARLLDTVASA